MAHYFRPAAKANWGDLVGTSHVGQNWTISGNVCTVSYPLAFAWWLAGYDTGTMYKTDSTFNWKGVCRKIDPIPVETFYTVMFHCRDITKGNDNLWYVVQNYSVSGYGAIWVFNEDWSFNRRIFPTVIDSNPSGAWQDSATGNWYVVGLSSPNTVRMYDSSWNLISPYTLTNMTDNFPTGISKGLDGYFYIVNKAYVYKYNSSFVYQTRYSLSYTETPTVYGTNAYGICLGDDGYWYVPDITDDRVNIYNSSWTHIANHNTVGDSVMTGLMYTYEKDDPGLAVGDIVSVTNGGVITDGDYTITGVSSNGFTFNFTASDQTGTLDWREYVWYDTLTAGSKLTSTPTSSDDVTITRGWCLSTADMAVSSLTVNRASRLDLYTYALTSTGTTIVNGVLGVGVSASTGLTTAGLTLNSGTSLTGAFLDMVQTSKFFNSGNFSCSSFTIFTVQNVGDYTQTGNGSYNNPNTSNVWYNFRLNADCMLTQSSNTIITNQSSGTTGLYGTLSRSTYTTTIGAGSAFTLNASADITGSGNLTLAMTNAAVLNWGRASAISDTGAVIIPSPSSIMKVPAVNLSNNAWVTLTPSQNSAATYRFSSGSFSCKNFYITQPYNQGVTVDLATNNPSFDVVGYINLKNDSSTYTLTWTKGTGITTLAGTTAGADIINFQNKSIGAVVINNTIGSLGVKRLTATAVFDSLHIISGTLDSQTYTVTCSGDLTLSSAEAVLKVGSGGVTANSLSGTGGFVQSLTSALRRVVSVANAGVCSGMTFKDISMGSRNKIHAKSACVNQGNNIGIVFKDISRPDIGGGLFYITDIVPSNVITVKYDAVGAANGSTWADAYTTLQAAISAWTSGKEIWVSAGTYIPSSTSTRTDSYQLPSGISIYGGFSGVERYRSSRNWVSNVTILSGDLGSSVYSYHVIRMDATAQVSGVVVDGFTISNGHADNAETTGGAILMSASTGSYSKEATFNNCVISNNLATGNGGAVNTGRYCTVTFNDCSFISNTSAALGGGYYGARSVTTFNRCSFTSNSCTNTAVSSGGGAIYVTTSLLAESLTVANCSFTSNVTAVTSSADNGGAGIYAYHNPGTFTLTDSVFTTNSGHYGAGVYVRAGSQASADGSSTTVSGCSFISNSATYGSAFFSSQHNTVLKNSFFKGNLANQHATVYMRYGNPTFLNSLVTGNKAVNLGAGVYVNTTNTFSITNCTIAGNRGEIGGGLAVIGGAVANVYNTILYGNQAGNKAQQVYATGSGTIVNLSYCGHNGGGDDLVSDTGGVINTANQVTNDPLFTTYVEPTAGAVPNTSGLYTLIAGSPCINTGDDTRISESYDVRGSPHVRKVGVVDRGAYELQL